MTILDYDFENYLCRIELISFFFRIHGTCSLSIDELVRNLFASFEILAIQFQN